MLMILLLLVHGVHDATDLSVDGALEHLFSVQIAHALVSLWHVSSLSGLLELRIPDSAQHSMERRVGVRTYP